MLLLQSLVDIKACAVAPIDLGWSWISVFSSVKWAVVVPAHRIRQRKDKKVFVSINLQVPWNSSEPVIPPRYSERENFEPQNLSVPPCNEGEIIIGCLVHYQWVGLLCPKGRCPSSSFLCFLSQTWAGPGSWGQSNPVHSIYFLSSPCMEV